MAKSKKTRKSNTHDVARSKKRFRAALETAWEAYYEAEGFRRKRDIGRAFDSYVSAVYDLGIAQAEIGYAEEEPEGAGGLLDLHDHIDVLHDRLGDLVG